jgi:radical SAM protein with 4Fe4S-binding SPASM domain
MARAFSKSYLDFEEVVHLEKDRVHLYLDPEYPNWISTNKVGAEVIESLTKSHLEETVQTVSEKWGLEIEVARRHIHCFLEELKEKEFIGKGQNEKKKYPGRSSVVECGQLKELWIYTNTSCNLRCKHCFVSAGEVRKDVLSATEIKALVDEAMSLGAFRFYFTGGEPFLRNDIFELIEYILRSKKNELIILSNGTLFSGALLKKLKRFREDNLTIQVSLEGPNALINDSVRGTGSFESAVQGIKNLAKIDMAPIVTTTLTNRNASHLIEMPDLLSSLKVKNYHILWLQNSGRAKQRLEDLEVSPEKVTDIMRDLIGRSRELGIIVDNEVSLQVRARSKRGRKHDLCNSCFEMMCVDSDGQVYPCAPLTGEEKFDCGSIRKDSLRDIWLNSKEAQRIRDNSVLTKEGCRACHLRFICGGGCFCQSFLGSKRGEISAADPYCSTLKVLIHDVIWDLAIPKDFDEDENYYPPRVLAAMGNKLFSCSVSSTKVTDFSFEIGTYHCSCVLGVELEGDGSIGGDRNRLARDACFNELAQEYIDWLGSPIGLAYNKLAKEKVYSLIDLKEGDKVLDVGCGTGNYALDFSQKSTKVVGIDASEWMLRICIKGAREKKVNLDIRHGFGEDLPFPDSSFDIVLGMNVLEFSQIPEKAISEMFRVLKNGGHLILGVLNKKSLWGMTQGFKKSFAKGAYYEARFFEAQELCQLFNGEGNGLQVSTTIFFPPINQKGLLKASGFFEWIGQTISPQNGALIVAKATKAT